MNERVPDSSGLPLRAMVMVLLFLGVVFLLVGFQAMGSSGGSQDESNTPVITTTSTTSSTAPASPAAAKADVRVYNISSDEGAAARTADRLKAAGWNVTETGNLSLEDVPATTVYFSDAAGEHAAADEVGKLLEAPVAPRVAGLADQPPGVIVVVTG
jgi:hypothetical protein